MASALAQKIGILRPAFQAAGGAGWTHESLLHALGLKTLCEADLAGAMLDKAQLPNASLFHARLQGACLNEAMLFWTNLTGADMAGARLNGAYMNYTRLNGANLQGAEMKKVNLFNAFMESADLSGANLEGADLTRVDLTGANMTSARLKNAILSETALLSHTALWRGADMEGVRLSSDREICRKIGIEQDSGEFELDAKQSAPIIARRLRELGISASIPHHSSHTP